jgi:hypothetical protein
MNLIGRKPATANVFCGIVVLEYRGAFQFIRVAPGSSRGEYANPHLNHDERSKNHAVIFSLACFDGFGSSDRLIG